jgi:hypothetical protein
VAAQQVNAFDVEQQEEVVCCPRRARPVHLVHALYCGRRSISTEVLHADGAVAQPGGERQHAVVGDRALFHVHEQRAPGRKEIIGQGELELDESRCIRRGRHRTWRHK